MQDRPARRWDYVPVVNYINELTNDCTDCSKWIMDWRHDHRGYFIHIVKKGRVVSLLYLLFRKRKRFLLLQLQSNVLFSPGRNSRTILLLYYSLRDEGWLDGWSKAEAKKHWEKNQASILKISTYSFFLKCMPTYYMALLSHNFAKDRFYGISFLQQFGSTLTYFIRLISDSWDGESLATFFTSFCDNPVQIV